jgi:hypothetical protein
MNPHDNRELLAKDTSHFVLDQEVGRTISVPVLSGFDRIRCGESQSSALSRWPARTRIGC